MKRPLRIFLCCQQASRRHAVPAYGFWGDYFRGSFHETGHTCLEAPDCDWGEGLMPLDPDARAAWSERTWRAAIEFLRCEHAREPVDFFLGYLFPTQILPGAIAEIRALGIPCVNFFCDNVREFRDVPGPFRDFDLHWVPEHKALPLYARAGLPHLHAPMACWVPPAWRSPVVTETYPPTFVGTRDEQREALFIDAFAQGIELELRGAGWESAGTIPALPPPPARNPFERARRQWQFARQHGWGALRRKLLLSARPRQPLQFDFATHAKPVPVGDGYWQVLRESRVCVGVNRYPSLRVPFDRPDSYSRLRDLEAPMAGACYLTEWTEGLDRLYAPGSEIETYRDAGEMAAKVRELSGDPVRRKAMRIAAQRRALADHTIARTIDRIAGRLGC
jgi:hypothetical protein